MKTGAWTSQYIIHGGADVAAAYTNMPATDSFLFSSNRHVTLVNITGMTYVRLKVNRQATNATIGAKLILRYSPTFSATIGSYIDIGITEVSVPVDIANTYQVSEWIEIDPTALSYGDVYLAIIGNGGNGTLDPAFGNISVSFC